MISNVVTVRSEHTLASNRHVFGVDVRNIGSCEALVNAEHGIEGHLPQSEEAEEWDEDLPDVHDDIPDNKVD